MISRDPYLGQIDQLGSLSAIMGAYEEIAAARMQKVRGRVLENRVFMDSISPVYQQVRSFSSQMVALHKIETQKRRNGKTALVYISSNTGLFGAIIQKTFQLFLEDLQKTTADAVVVGRVGRSLLIGTEPKRPFVYFDFPDNKIDFEQLDKIVKFLDDYTSVRVYYGVFRNVLTQVPVASNVSGDLPVTTEELKPEHWIFEPTMSAVLTFFETEIFSSLFAQTVHESQLAKFSSQMSTMDQAGENIKRTLRKVRLASIRYKHRLINRKQLALAASVALWAQQ